jgi:hypothetical protein
VLACINAAGRRGPDLRQEVLIPSDGNGSPGASRRHDSPDPADLRRGIQVPGSESGIDPAAGPAISTKGLMSPVIR